MLVCYKRLLFPKNCDILVKYVNVILCSLIFFLKKYLHLSLELFLLQIQWVFAALLIDTTL